MATREEILKAMKPLQRSFGRFLTYLRPEDRSELWEDYASELQDLQVEALLLAIRTILNDPKERYHFPDIGEIRAAASTFTTPQQLLPAEAWCAVMSGTADKAGLAYCVFRQLRFDRSDIGRMSSNEAGNCQARFLTAYREAVTRETADAKLPQAMRDALPQPTTAPQLEAPEQANERAKQKAEEEAAYRKWFGQHPKQAMPLRAPQSPSVGQPRKVTDIATQRDKEAHQRKVREQAAALLRGKNSEEESA